MAEQMLRHEIEFLEGVRQLHVLAHWVPTQPDELFARIQTVWRETAEVPLGDSRRFWSAQYLAEIDAKTIKYLVDVRDGVLEDCRRIVERLGEK